MPKVEFFREYNGKNYFVQNGNVCDFINGVCHILVPKQHSVRCLGTAMEGSLFFFFEDEICRIRGESIEIIKIDLSEADVCCLYNGVLYWKAGEELKRKPLFAGVEEVFDLGISTQATKIEVNNEQIFISDTKGFFHRINWERRSCISQKIHADSLQDFIICGNTLITASRDKYIKKYIIDSQTLKFIGTSRVLPHFANCIVSIPFYYLVGLSNGQIALIDEKLKNVSLKSVNQDSIRSIQCIDKGYITSSDDGCCYLIEKDSIQKRVRKKLLYGNIQDKIQCSAFDGKALYVGFLSGKIERVMESAEIAEYSRSIICKLKNVRCLCIVGKMVLAGLENGDIYNVINKTRLSKGGETPYSMSYADGFLFVGRRDGNLDLYEVGEDLLHHNKRIKAHHSIIGDILVINDTIITCSDDQSICVWDRGLNIISSEKASEKNTALNNVVTDGKVLFVSSDNGYVYKVQGDNKEGIRLSRHPIRSLYWNNSLYAGDRRGNIYNILADGGVEKLYQGHERVVNIYQGESHERIMVIFEDVVMTMEGKGMSKDKIFIIHGHNNELKKEVLLLLERQNIEGIILADKADKGRTIIDKLIEEAAPAKFAVALLTPDDVVLDSSGISKNYRARQNVVLEIGYFLGRLGKNRVVMLRMKDVEIPSDLQGILYKNVDDIENGSWKTELAKELDEAGFIIDFKKLIKG